MMDIEIALNRLQRLEHDFPEQELEFILDHPVESAPALLEDWRSILGLNLEQLIVMKEVRYLYGLHFLTHWKNPDFLRILLQLLKKKSPDFLGELLGEGWSESFAVQLAYAEDSSLTDEFTGILTDDSLDPVIRLIAFQALVYLVGLGVIAEEKWYQITTFIGNGGISKNAPIDLWQDFASFNILSNVPWASSWSRYVISEMGIPGKSVDYIEAMIRRYADFSSDQIREVIREIFEPFTDPIRTIKYWPIYQDYFMDKFSKEGITPRKPKKPKKKKKDKRW